MTRTLTVTVVLAAALLSGGVLADQEPQRSESPRFRVAVDAVRIDVVVTDRDGRIVNDLGADDFEVRQDGRPQKVTFAQFIPVFPNPELSSNRALAPGRPGNPPGLSSPAPAPALARANIQRTLALVVDDLGLSVESLFYVKRGCTPSSTATCNPPIWPASCAPAAPAGRCSRSRPIDGFCMPPSMRCAGTASPAAGSKHSSRSTNQRPPTAGGAWPIRPTSPWSTPCGARLRLRGRSGH